MLIPVVGLTSIAFNTKVNWLATNVPVPAGVLCCEHEQIGRQRKDRLKIGDGTSLYAELPYTTDEVFTYEYLLPFALKNNANGLIELDGSGTIPESFFLDALINGPRVVSTITERDAIPLDDRYCIIIVADASLDPSVNNGGASYIWHFADGLEPGYWLKITEYESIDIDFSEFVKQDDPIDRLADSINYVKTTTEEREILPSMHLETKEYHFSPNINFTVFNNIEAYIGGLASDLRRHSLEDNAFLPPSLIIIDNVLS